jgi:hypothetical protein
MGLMEPTHSYVLDGVEYHVKFVVEPSTGELQAIDSDDISHGAADQWKTGVPDGLESGIPDDQDCENFRPPLPESIRPGKKPKMQDSELSEKDLARRNRRRAINRECARHARERRNHERDQLKNRIKELTSEKDDWKNKVDALLKKNKQLSLKLENAKSTTQNPPTQKPQLTPVYAECVDPPTQNPPTQKPKLKEQETQTYQPGEYSNSNFSRNIMNGSYKRRAVLLQAVEPSVANKKAKMQFIYPVQSNSTSEKNDSNVTKKKYVIMNKEQITNEVNNNLNKNHFNNLQKAVTYQTISNQTASNDSITNSSTKSNQTSVDLSKSPMCKNEIAAMIAMMMRPMQQQIQMLTNKISYLENAADIKIEP